MNKIDIKIQEEFLDEPITLMLNEQEFYLSEDEAEKISFYLSSALQEIDKRKTA